MVSAVGRWPPFTRAMYSSTEKEGIYEMTLKGAFYYHYYENYYTLAYIDKMWNLMRTTPFPTGLKL